MNQQPTGESDQRVQRSRSAIVIRRNLVRRERRESVLTGNQAGSGSLQILMAPRNVDADGSRSMHGLASAGARAPSDEPSASGVQLEPQEVAGASLKAHVRFPPCVCVCGVEFVPRKAGQRHHAAGCRAEASRQRKQQRLDDLLERVNPCDPGRPE
jgi:hypothetical protein